MKKTDLLFNLILVILYFAFFYAGIASFAPEGFDPMGFVLNNPAILLVVAAILLIAFIILNLTRKAEAKPIIFLLVSLIVIAALSVATWLHIDFHRFERFSWDRPNIILIDIDTLRADHVGAYGFDLASTPAFDKLASEGWLFESAFSHIPITMPSHSGMFTSKLPSDAKVFNNRDDLPDGDITLAEVLKNNGYATSGFISLGVLKSNFKINRGFDTYNDSLPKNGQWFNTADVITDRGINWLKERDAEKPFFMWLHYSDPHEPYCIPGKGNDTAIILNGDKIAEGSLNTAARIETEITLKPGLNEIEFLKIGDDSITARYLSQIYFTGIDNSKLPELWQEKLKASSTKRRLYRDLQNEVFMRGFRDFTFAGLKISEGPGWHKSDNSSRLVRRSLHSDAIIRIENTTGQPMNVTFNIKGGVYKEIDAVRKDYAEEVEFADAQVARLIAYLEETGLDNNTIIVLMADHGEELNEHGLVGHIHNLYTQSLHVPLVIKDPTAGRKGLREKRIAGLIDLAPTLLDMCAIAVPETWEGRTLMEYLNIPSAPDRTHFSQTFSPEANTDKFGIYKDNLYSIFTPEVERYLQLEAFDTSSDKEQWVNLTLRSGFSGINDLSTSFSSYAASIKRNEESGETDDEREEMLKDLGYIMSEDEVADKKVYLKPTQEFVDTVNIILDKLKESGVTSHEVTVRELSENVSYLSISLSLAEEQSNNQIIAIQNFVRLNIVNTQSDYIYRLTVQQQEKTILDVALPDNEALRNLRNYN